MSPSFFYVWSSQIMIIYVISPFLSTHRNDRKWLRITKIITWQKIFVFVQIHCQHFYAELHVCTGLILYAGTHLWSMSILSSLASSPSSLRTSKPLNSASPSGPRPCPTWYIWRTSSIGFGDLEHKSTEVYMKISWPCIFT